MVQAFATALIFAGALGAETSQYGYRPNYQVPSYPSYPTYERPEFTRPQIPTYGGYTGPQTGSGYNSDPWSTKPSTTSRYQSNPWATQTQTQTTQKPAYTNPWTSQQQTNTYTNPWTTQQKPQQQTNTYTNPWSNQQTQTPPTPPTPKPTYTPTPTPPKPTPIPVYTPPTPSPPVVDPKPTTPEEPTYDSFVPSYGDHHASFDKFFGQETIYLLQKDLARLAAYVEGLKEEIQEVKDGIDNEEPVTSGGGPFFNFFSTNDNLIEDFTYQVGPFCVSSGTAGSVFDFEAHFSIDTSAYQIPDLDLFLLLINSAGVPVAQSTTNTVGEYQSLSIKYQAVLDSDSEFTLATFQPRIVDFQIKPKEAMVSYKLWNKDDFEFTNTLPAACST